MTVGWSSLTFTPDAEAVTELATSWGWRIGEPFTPLLFSILGDVFVQLDSGGVHWLNTGTGELGLVATDVDAFRARLATDIADEWFMPALVGQLHAAGKIPEAGQCYTYIILPIFAEGQYSVENLVPVSARDHFGVTGHIHREIANAPQGGGA